VKGTGQGGARDIFGFEILNFSDILGLKLCPVVFWVQRDFTGSFGFFLKVETN